MVDLLNETRRAFLDFVKFVELQANHALASNNWPEPERELLFAVKKRKKFTEEELRKIDRNRSEIVRLSEMMLKQVNDLPEEMQSTIIICFHQSLRSIRAIQQTSGIRTPMPQELSAHQDDVRAAGREKKRSSDDARMKRQCDVLRSFIAANPTNGMPAKYIDLYYNDLNKAADAAGVDRCSRATWNTRMKQIGHLSSRHKIKA